jgi:hypothetical protein
VAGGPRLTAGRVYGPGVLPSKRSAGAFCTAEHPPRFDLDGATARNVATLCKSRGADVEGEYESTKAFYGTVR